MKFSTALLLALACTLVTKAAPITPVPEPAAASTLQDLTPSNMDWQGAPSEPVQQVTNNNPWDKRDMGWQAVPSNPQEVKNDPWDTNPWDKRDGESAEVDTVI
ncbi:hypothetical protein BGZ88_001122 [Linnemannia elongata]|nr:hypothetical protein BGZ88_001122 [Linnemannia elongata]KAK5809314.1 hypothetical protein F5H01DRAFT_323577 [Linnemannia elongata]